MAKRLLLVLAVLGLGAALLLFFGAAKIADERMNKVAATLLAVLSPAAVKLDATLAVADLHDDLLLWPRPILERSKGGHVDLPRLIEGRVALQVFSSVTKTPQGMNYDKNDSTTDNIRMLAVIGIGFWNAAETCFGC